MRNDPALALALSQRVTRKDALRDLLDILMKNQVPVKKRLRAGTHVHPSIGHFYQELLGTRYPVLPANNISKVEKIVCTIPRLSSSPTRMSSPLDPSPPEIPLGITLKAWLTLHLPPRSL